jgi:hypothetical protein
MKKITIFITGCLLLCISLPAQDKPRELKGGGHLLGETVEQFYAESHVAELFAACQGRDWKNVNQLYNSPEHSSKNAAKDICAKHILGRKQANAGARVEYQGSGDQESMRADKFLLDGGHLVRIDMTYGAPAAILEGAHPKTFAELLAGLQEAYGDPTKSYTEAMVNNYGVKSDAHRATWIGKYDVISIVEQPGTNGWTEIVAQTIAEYNRALQAPKTTNPLQ